MNIRGKLYVIEGLDGSGKQTQTELLYKKLMEETNGNVRMVSFPNYDSPSSSLVKLYLSGDLEHAKKYHIANGMTNEFVRSISRFYAIDRLSTFIMSSPEENSLLEFYNNGGIILCDRYYTSNQLHQSAFIEGDKADIFDFVDFVRHHETVSLGLPIPEKVFFLKTSPETSINNIKKRYNGTDNKEDIHENIEHLTKILKYRESIIAKEQWHVIDCEKNGQMRPVESIAANIYTSL